VVGGRNPNGIAEINVPPELRNAVLCFKQRLDSDAAQRAYNARLDNFNLLFKKRDTRPDFILLRVPGSLEAGTSLY